MLKVTMFWNFAGASPYPGLSAQEVLKYVSIGKKMNRPNHCTKEM